MKFFKLFLFLIFAEFHVQAENDYALALTQTTREFKFPKFQLYEALEEFQHYKQDYKSKGIYFKCPKIKSEEKNALYTVRVYYYEMNEQKICEVSLEPMMFKLKNIKNERIQIFHIGYQVFLEDSKIIRFPDYEFMPEGFYLTPIIAFYRDAITYFVLAVQYKISNAFIFKPPVYTDTFTFQDTYLKPNLLRNFFRIQRKYLKEKFDADYKEFFNKSARRLIPIPLADENDFAPQALKKATYYNYLISAMWSEYKEKWREVENFVRQLAVNLGTAKITTGVGKLLKLKKGEQTYEMYWEKYGSMVFVPELFWKAIEFENYDSWKGIFIIMHNNPFIPVDELRLICQEDICIKEKLWEPTDYYEEVKKQVYCCEIDDTAIKNLNVEFLFKKIKSITLQDIIKPIYFPSGRY